MLTRYNYLYGHNGQLGLCLLNTLESLKQNEPFSLYDSIEDINNYIKNFYGSFHKNKTCKFLCSSKLQEKTKIKFRYYNNIRNTYGNL